MYCFPRDTAGQERFRFLTNAYFRGAKVIVMQCMQINTYHTSLINSKGMALVYDVTSMTSFENVTRWLETIEKVCYCHMSRATKYQCHLRSIEHHGSSGNSSGWK